MFNKNKKIEPIKLDDEKLIKEVERIRIKKAGLKKTLDEITASYGDVELENKNWWDKVFAKYNIPEEYRENTKHILNYDYKTKMISEND